MKIINNISLVTSMAIRETFYYKGVFLTSFTTSFIRFCIIIFMYSYTYNLLNSSDIKGVALTTVVWSILFYFLILSWGIRKVSDNIMEDIISGNITNFINKPINYLMFRVSLIFGRGLLSVVLFALFTVPMCLYLFDIPAIFYNYTLILIAILLTFLSIILLFLIYVLVGLCSFWIEDIRPILNILNKLFMIFGGAYIPVGLFPEWLYTIGLYSPFGAAQSFTHIFYNNFSNMYMNLVFIQFFWILILLMAVYITFKYARKIISTNGG